MPSTPSVILELESLRGETSEELSRLAWSALLRASSADDLAIALDFAIENELIDGYFAPHFRGERITDAADRYWVHPDTGLEMVWIPAGNYPVGDSEDMHEFPHDGFFLSRHPVTNQQFSTFLASGYEPHPDVELGGPFLRHFGNEGQPSDDQLDHPVVWVSQQDAEAYCEKHRLCLPSEWEWESAARGLEGAVCPWGTGRSSAYSPPSVAGTLRGMWAENDKSDNLLHCHWRADTTCRVSKFAHIRSPFGCEQMVGNVSEWCRTELAPWESECTYDDTFLRPVRGACYKRRSLRRLRSSHRRVLNRYRRNNWASFRPALSVRRWFS